jgi:hypothetical protein
LGLLRKSSLCEKQWASFDVGMLNIQYIPYFRAGQPFLVITGDEQGFLKAASHFRNISTGLLNDKAITDRCDVSLLKSGPLYLTENECKEIANHFENVVASGEPRHAYMDIAALPAVELIISYKEYASL